MDVNIGQLSSSVTLADSDDLMEPRALERLVREVVRRVKAELAEERRRHAGRLGARPIDWEQY